MAQTIDDLAREIADYAVSTAKRAGYEAKRASFFLSSIGNLEADIALWLQENMQTGES